MTRAFLRGVAVGAAVTGAAALLQAAGPVFWQVSTQADLLQGDAEAVAIDRQGRLTLGRAAATVYEAGAPFLWDLVVDDAGRAWAGTGNDGRVVRLDPDGTATVVFDAGELEAHALALAPDGALYVGTSPDGRVYRVEPGGAAAEVFDPDEQYIWALAVADDGSLFVATGPGGLIYRVPPGGAGARYYETGAEHAMTLAVDDAGRLLAGTASPARVFRIDAADDAFVLLDAAYAEVRRLRVAPDGTVYAAVLGMPAAGAPAPQGAPGAAQATATVTVTVAPAGGAAAASPAGAAGAVYRILPSGLSDRIWDSATDAPYDVSPGADGGLVVATGNAGRVFVLGGDPLDAVLAADLDAQQITALAREASGALLLATANPGRLARLGAGPATQGTYVSVVRDAGASATWGTIAWQGDPGGGSIAVATRSGNTGTPDGTWSDWSGPAADPAGSPIASPAARFLQWRAVLTAGAGAPPVLDSVTAAYLPRNTRPQVASITIHPPGTVFQETFPSVPGLAGFEPGRPEREADAPAANGGGLGRREYQAGLQTFEWRGSDEDQDEIVYTLQYRRETDTAWTLLRDDLRTQIFVWDTTAVPNGRYVLRVVASDAPSNSPATRLTGQLDSRAFTVDNTAPAIEGLAVTAADGVVRVRFLVRDADSPVVGADVSLGADRWEAAYPLDGIADSRVETFEFEIPAGGSAREVVVRGTDAVGNVATAAAPLPD